VCTCLVICSYTFNVDFGTFNIAVLSSYLIPGSRRHLIYNINSVFKFTVCEFSGKSVTTMFSS